MLHHKRALAFTLGLVGLLFGLLFVLSPSQAAPAMSNSARELRIIAPVANALLTDTHATLTMTYVGTQTLLLGDITAFSVTIQGSDYLTTLTVLPEPIDVFHYTTTWSLPLRDYSPYTLTAQITHITGSTTSEPQRVYVDRVAPQDVWIASSTPRVTDPTTITLSWGATDASPVITYTLYYSLNDQDWEKWIPGTTAISSTFPISEETLFLSPHHYTFRVDACDIGHNCATAETAVIVGDTKIFLPLVMRNYPPRFDNVSLATVKHTYDYSITLNLTASVIGDRINQIKLRNYGESDWAIVRNITPTALTVNETFEWSLPSDSGLYTIEALVSGDIITSAIVQASTYYVPNGNFASLEGWTVHTAPLPVTLATKEHLGDVRAAEGTNMLLLGNPTYPYNNVPIGYAGATRTFEVPLPSDEVPFEGSPRLRFKYIVWSQDRSIDGNYDRFEVYINNRLVFHDGNQNPTQGDVWWRVPSPQNPRRGITSGWGSASILLNDYVGEEITVSFRNYSRYDNWYNTYTYIDDVHITGEW